MSKKIPNNPTRSCFIENCKKNKKAFPLAVVNLLLNRQRSYLANGDIFPVNGLDIISHVLSNVDSPAKMWDETSIEGREILWDSLRLCLRDEQKNLMSKQKEIQETEDWMCLHNGNLNRVVDDYEDDTEDDSNDDENTDTDPTSSIPGWNVNLDDDDDDEDYPEFLYHGTPTINVDEILRDGLLPMNRKHVFLWESESKAKEVAERHGSQDISILKVNVEEFIEDGYVILTKDFGHGDGKQYFVTTVPPDYLDVV